MLCWTVLQYVISSIIQRNGIHEYKGKMMLPLLWDSKAPILEHYLHRSTTGNNVYYCEMPWDWVRLASLNRPPRNGDEGCYIVA
jgi:hypothetical protein